MDLWTPLRYLKKVSIELLSVACIFGQSGVLAIVYIQNSLGCSQQVDKGVQERDESFVSLTLTNIPLHRQCVILIQLFVTSLSWKIIVY